MKNNVTNTNITSTNAMSLRQLIIRENAELQQIINPHNGKCFFMCGSKQGYISPKALEALNAGKGVDYFKYAEVSINGNAPVPCLMVVGNSDANVKRRLGAELLRK